MWRLNRYRTKYLHQKKRTTVANQKLAELAEDIDVVPDQIFSRGAMELNPLVSAQKPLHSTSRTHIPLPKDPRKDPRSAIRHEFLPRQINS
jgi:hypothetical protein